MPEYAHLLHKYTGRKVCACLVCGQAMLQLLCVLFGHPWLLILMSRRPRVPPQSLRAGHMQVNSCLQGNCKNCKTTSLCTYISGMAVTEACLCVSACSPGRSAGCGHWLPDDKDCTWACVDRGELAVQWHCSVAGSSATCIGLTSLLLQWLQVDAHLSFDTRATVDKALHLLDLYSKHGIDPRWGCGALMQC
jgi:hypothetical protein